MTIRRSGVALAVSLLVAATPSFARICVWTCASASTSTSTSVSPPSAASSVPPCHQHDAAHPEPSRPEKCAPHSGAEMSALVPVSFHAAPAPLRLADAFAVSGPAVPFAAGMIPTHPLSRGLSPPILSRRL